MCLFVCLLFIGHTTFVHFAALPPSPRAGAVAGGPARAGKHAQREHARACRTTSQRKNRTLMPFKNKTVRAHAVVYVTAEIFKKGKKKTNMPLPKFSLQFAFSWSVYLIFGRSRPWSASIYIYIYSLSSTDSIE